MAFVALFIYLNYMSQIGHEVSYTSMIVLIIIGLAQTTSWWVNNFLKIALSVGDDDDDDNKKVKRLDDCLRG